MKNELPGDPTLPPGVTKEDFDPPPKCFCCGCEITENQAKLFECLCKHCYSDDF